MREHSKQKTHIWCSFCGLAPHGLVHDRSVPGGKGVEKGHANSGTAAEGVPPTRPQAALSFFHQTRRVRKQTIPGELGRAPSTGESHPSKLPKLVLPFTPQIWLENSLLRVRVGLHHGLSVCWQRRVKMGRNLQNPENMKIPGVLNQALHLVNFQVPVVCLKQTHRRSGGFATSPRVLQERTPARSEIRGLAAVACHASLTSLPVAQCAQKKQGEPENPKANR